MRRTTFAVAAAVAAFTLPGAASAAPTYDHACRGTVDTMCYTYWCVAVDCFRQDCVVYVNVSTATQVRCWG